MAVSGTRCSAAWTRTSASATPNSTAFDPTCLTTSEETDPFIFVVAAFPGQIEWRMLATTLPIEPEARLGGRCGLSEGLAGAADEDGGNHQSEPARPRIHDLSPF